MAEGPSTRDEGDAALNGQRGVAVSRAAHRVCGEARPVVASFGRDT